MKIISSYKKSRVLFERSVKLSFSWPYFPYGNKDYLKHMIRIQAFSQHHFFSALLEKKLLEKQTGRKFYINGVWERYPMLSENNHQPAFLSLIFTFYKILRRILESKKVLNEIKQFEILVVSSGRHFNDLLPTVVTLNKIHRVYVIGKFGNAEEAELKNNNVAFINISHASAYLGRMQRIKNLVSSTSVRISFNNKSFVFKTFLWKQRVWYLRLFEFPEVMALLYNAQEIISKSKPKLVLTTSSNDTFGATFSIKAKQTNIPVAEIIHGFAAWDLGSQFSNSDYQLVWGKPSTEVRKQFSTQTLIVGCPFLQQTTIEKNNKNFKNAGLKVLVLIAPPFGFVTLFQSVPNRDMARSLLMGLSNLPKIIEVTIRSHPSYNFLEDVRDLNIQNNIKISNEGNTKDAIAASGLVITQPTTAGFEAILQKKLLLFFDNTYLTDHLSHPFVKSGSAVNVPFGDLGSIDRYVLNLLNDTKRIAKQKKAQSKFAKDYCSYYGDESCDKISQFAERIIKDARKTSN